MASSWCLFKASLREDLAMEQVNAKEWSANNAGLAGKESKLKVGATKTLVAHQAEPNEVTA